MANIFARKPIAELLADEGTSQSLKRVLGAGDLIMLAIGAVIGAGIFGAIGTAAAGQVGPGGGGADRTEDAGANHRADGEHDQVAGAEHALQRSRGVGFIDDEFGNGLSLEE